MLGFARRLLQVHARQAGSVWRQRCGPAGRFTTPARTFQTTRAQVSLARSAPCRLFHYSPRSLSASETDSPFGDLSRSELQKLAKEHNIRANMKSVEIIRELEAVAQSAIEESPASSAASDSSTGSSPSKTLTWPPQEEDDSVGEANDWLAPSDVDPSNRRVVKQRQQAASEAADSHSVDPENYLASELDPDAARHTAESSSLGGLEAQPDKLIPHDDNIVEGQPLTKDHIVWILAQNNARNISAYHAPTEFGRVDGEYYIVASALSLRHLQSLRDSLIHAVKQTKIPGLSSAAVALGSKRRTPQHWEVIDLNDILIHIMTEHGRELYSLESMWRESSFGRTLALDEFMEDETAEL